MAEDKSYTLRNPEGFCSPSSGSLNLERFPTIATTGPANNPSRVLFGSKNIPISSVFLGSKDIVISPVVRLSSLTVPHTHPENGGAENWPEKAPLPQPEKGGDKVLSSDHSMSPSAGAKPQAAEVDAEASQLAPVKKGIPLETTHVVPATEEGHLVMAEDESSTLRNSEGFCPRSSRIPKHERPTNPSTDTDSSTDTANSPSCVLLGGKDISPSHAFLSGSEDIVLSHAAFLSSLIVPHAYPEEGGIENLPEITPQPQPQPEEGGDEVFFPNHLMSPSAEVEPQAAEVDAEDSLFVDSLFSQPDEIEHPSLDMPSPLKEKETPVKKGIPLETTHVVPAAEDKSHISKTTDPQIPTVAIIPSAGSPFQRQKPQKDKEEAMEKSIPLSTNNKVPAAKGKVLRSIMPGHGSPSRKGTLYDEICDHAIAQTNIGNNATAGKVLPNVDNDDGWTEVVVHRIKRGQGWW